MAFEKYELIDLKSQKCVYIYNSLRRAYLSKFWRLILLCDTSFCFPYRTQVTVHNLCDIWRCSYKDYTPTPFFITLYSELVSLKRPLLLHRVISFYLFAAADYGYLNKIHERTPYFISSWSVPWKIARWFWVLPLRYILYSYRCVLQLRRSNVLIYNLMK